MGEHEMPTTSVISAFDAEIAGKVVEELLAAGLPERDVEVLEGDEDRLVEEIVGRGFGEDDARGFAEQAGGGKRLVAAKVPEEEVDRAVAIMERHEAAEGGGERRGSGAGETVPVVEEGLEVGKRRVAAGGARVTSRVVERPVQRTVTLREERVEAERRRADRELSPEEAEAAFEGRTVEVVGTAEEAEVRKTARVVGEVALGKRVEERKETVRDKVRRTEVEVEEVGPASRERK
jgi:stress response protein YsnF